MKLRRLPLKNPQIMKINDKKRNPFKKKSTQDSKSTIKLSNLQMMGGTTIISETRNLPAIKIHNIIAAVIKIPNTQPGEAKVTNIQIQLTIMTTKKAGDRFSANIGMKF